MSFEYQDLNPVLLLLHSSAHSEVGSDCLPDPFGGVACPTQPGRFLPDLLKILFLDPREDFQQGRELWALEN